ncbi:MAG: hypothetical protein JNK47_05275 [Mesorhizobium sp.]|nr:hypothetical protein [Mesorhizobium sp.]MBL8576614.1 hypothetical protein [Mesorhizobium sp.]
MRKKRAIAIADRAAPLALKLVSAANLLFLASFVMALAMAVDVVRP